MYYKLPILEYADFLFDRGIIHINKATQKLQNLGLLIAHSQHILPYAQRDSRETLHRKNSNLSRLVHRRKLYLLQFAFHLNDGAMILDDRNIPRGIVFQLPKIDHKCVNERNNLPVNTSFLF